MSSRVAGPGGADASGSAAHAVADGDVEFEPRQEDLRRKHTTKWRHVERDVIPSWISETDFDLCPAIVEAVRGLLDRGDLGYPDWAGEPLAEPFAERMHTRYGWSPGPADVRHVCDLIQALQVVVEVSTAPGDAVALHVPNYPPFLRTLTATGRRAVGCPLVADDAAAGGWSFDADQLEREVREANAKVLLVVNPHNPTGRVFTVSELEALAEVACRHDMVVVSDELHGELTHGTNVHVPVATLGDEVADRTVTITSATKSFNLGGVRVAVAHVGDARVRRAWDRLPAEYFGSLNVVGVEATLAAWRDGDAWLERQRRHLTAMRDHLVSRVGDELPGVSVRSPQATYLAWLDCRGAGLGDDPAALFRAKARVELVGGPLFGTGGAGHARLNFGTGRAILDEILDRLRASLSVAA